jgi:sulfatase modifying factor 1
MRAWVSVWFNLMGGFAALATLALASCGGRVAATGDAVPPQDAQVDALPDSADAMTDSANDSANYAPPGAGVTNCGPGGTGSESCSTSLEVTGGSFYRSYDPVFYADKSYPATISTFRLDKYEITVGRFRQFVTAVVGGWRPAPGSGKHTHLNGGNGLSATGGGYEAGWDSSWTSSLAASDADWNTNLKYMCDEAAASSTWTPSGGSNESKAITCETWYEAYAFCIWDGGFLPSEAEWNYAAAGGGGVNGQRVYPWSSPSTSATADCSFANYFAGARCSVGGVNDVGSESPKGDGAYGQADLAGNVFEWNLDSFVSPYVNPCIDCVNLTPAVERVFRGGGIAYNSTALLTAARNVYQQEDRTYRNGARCARAP